MTDETVVAYCNQFADKAMRLNAAARANHDTLLDFDERSDKHVVAEFAFIYISGGHYVDVATTDDIANSRRQSRSGSGRAAHGRLKHLMDIYVLPCAVGYQRN